MFSLIMYSVICGTTPQGRQRRAHPGRVTWGYIPITLGLISLMNADLSDKIRPATNPDHPRQSSG